MQKVPNAKVGFSKAMSAGWISVDKASKPPLIKKAVQSIEDTVKQDLSNPNALSEKLKLEYKKRKLLQESVVKYFVLTRGSEFSTELKRLETDLTSEMLASGSWKTLKFKDYNLEALGAPPECGYLHPLLQVRTEFRQIFLEMGFEEMATNNFVESSFWNFDALFQPQQHPARDAHDTFFVSDPANCVDDSDIPLEYLKRVKRVHSRGGYGSQVIKLI